MNSVNKIYISHLKLYLTGLLILVVQSVHAQDFESLVKLAWKNNKQLNSKNFQLESAVSSLKEAKAMYGPNLQVGLLYSLAEGGRKINFPVGDLLNPVYSTLNVLTQSNNFPTINNVEEQFLPNNFYDLRFRITQPLYYPDLAINKKIKSETIVLKNLEIKALKRIIVKDVMNAYFSSVAARKISEIYWTSDSLLTEAKRVTQSLIKNGTALPTALSRIETQMATLSAQKYDAEAQIRNADHYMKFLVGETFVESILIDELPVVESFIYNEREEILQMNQGSKMLSLALEKEKNFYKPKLGLQLDLGSQDFDFGIEPYVLAGLNVEMNLFDNNKHIYKKSSVQADMTALQLQKNYTEDQIGLQINIAKENLQAAVKQAETYKIRITAVEKMYSEVLKKYKEGSVNYLELLDAETQSTQIKLHYTLARQNAWMKWAEYMYATASFPIE
ncbi:MAG: TolC family protein [Saprospiraceae bacterium]|nr:TolC family protein [Saprospiraceae bacterium]MBP6693934.1 TolC family protein [Saprospiraceae bacterium]